MKHVIYCVKRPVTIQLLATADHLHNASDDAHATQFLLANNRPFFESLFLWDTITDSLKKEQVFWVGKCDNNIILDMDCDNRPEQIVTGSSAIVFEVTIKGYLEIEQVFMGM